MLIGVGVSCRISYSIVSKLYVTFSGLMRYLVWGREREGYFSAIVYLLLCGFASEGFPFLLGSWDRLVCFIVTLPRHS